MIQLALGLYINLPVGVLCTLGVSFSSADPLRASRTVRFRRVPDLEPGHRRLAIDARPRRTEGLVHRAKSGSRRRSPGSALPVCGAHVTTDESTFLNRDLLKSANFLAGTLLMFCGGFDHDRHPGAGATMLQNLMNYSAADHRSGDHAARHRQHGGDVPRRAADHPGRQPADHSLRLLMTRPRCGR